MILTLMLIAFLGLTPPAYADTPTPSYEELTCSSIDQTNISYIIKTTSESGIFTLLKIKKDLEARGKQIEHIHPLKFLGVIFSNPELKNHLKQIRSSRLKWSRFSQDLASNLASQTEKGNITPYLEDFAKEVDVNTETLFLFVKNGQWYEFLEYLSK